MRQSKLFVIGASVAMTAGVASADSINFYADPTSTTNGSPTGVSLGGTIEYSSMSSSSGQLIFTLNNTTDSSVGGFLTGLVFNIDSSDSGASASLASTTDSDFKDTGAEEANPFGMFDAGAALNANWSGGGNPSKGLAIGSTLTLIFDIMASDASSLTASSFFGDGTDIAMRFRGLNNGGSDKLTGTPNDPELNIAPLPAPVLAGGMMLGLGLGVRRLRSRK